MPHVGKTTAVRAAFGGLTDVGKKRKLNEDHFLVRLDLGLFLVADGMGGHNAGNVASKLATTSLARFFEATRHQSDFGHVPVEFQHLDIDSQRLMFGICKVNDDIYRVSSASEVHKGMGSTIVALHITANGKAHIGHVGDSRCYRISDGNIEQLTNDHSLINDIRHMEPSISEEEIARLPHNVITQALGMRPAVVPSIRSEPTTPGDVYLLCSDGLSGQVSEQDILAIAQRHPHPQTLCKHLVNASNAAGGKDNVSVIVIRIEQ